MVAALRPWGVIFCALVRGAVAAAVVEAYRVGQFEVRLRARIAPRAGCDRSMLERWGDSEQNRIKDTVELIYMRLPRLCRLTRVYGSIRSGGIAEG